MHARVATFEADESGGFDKRVEGIRKEIEAGNPPPGLENTKGILILSNRQNGKGLGIVLFESEEAMRLGDEALNKMSPQGGGRRSDVEFYEVAVQQMR
jgi:hypothetical protein